MRYDCEDRGGWYGDAALASGRGKVERRGHHSDEMGTEMAGVGAARPVRAAAALITLGLLIHCDGRGCSDRRFGVGHGEHVGQKKHNQQADEKTFHSGAL